MSTLNYVGKWMTFENDHIELLTIPNNSILFGYVVQVTEAFDAGSSNILSIGFPGNEDYFFSNGDVSTIGKVGFDEGEGNGFHSNSYSINAYYSQSGIPATHGKMYVCIFYLLAPPSP